MYVDRSGKFPVIVIIAALLFTPLGGTAAQIATSIASYVGMSIWAIGDLIFNDGNGAWDDMNKIHWNPFNSNENAVFASKHISFYKGVPVFLKNSGRSSSFYIISLNKYEPVDTLKHERGHNWQAMMMGIGTFAITVGIPSSLMLGPWSSNGNYYGAPWETFSDILGGVQSRRHTDEERLTAWMYYGTSLISVVLPYFFYFGNKIQE